MNYKNIEYVLGATTLFSFPILTDAGVPRDISSFVFRFEIYDPSGVANVILTMPTFIQGNVVSFTLNNSNSTLLNQGNYQFRLSGGIPSSGYQWTQHLVKGFLTVDQPGISSQPTYTSFAINQGTTWIRNIRLRTVSTTGSPIDLSGSTLTADIHKTVDGAVISNASISVSNPTSGDAVLTIDSSVLSTLTAGSSVNDPAGAYFLLLKITDSLSVTKTLLTLALQILAPAP